MSAEDDVVLKAKVEANMDAPIGPTEVELAKLELARLKVEHEALKALNAKTVTQPNGAPTVPQWVIKAGVGLALASGAVLLAPEQGIVLPAAVLSGAKLINMGLLLLGITSQGLRKQVQEATAKEVGELAANDPLKGLNK